MLVRYLLNQRKAMRAIFAAAIAIEAASLTGSVAGSSTPALDTAARRMPIESHDARNIPPNVRGAAREYVDECEAYGASPVPSDRYVSEVDLSDDGSPDYIIDTGELNASCFCGSGGCTIEAWVSNPSGYLKAYEGNVRGWQLSPKNKLPAMLIIDLHGTACGGVGVDLCLKALLYQDGHLVDTTAGR